MDQTELARIIERLFREGNVAPKQMEEMYVAYEMNRVFVTGEGPTVRISVGLNTFDVSVKRVDL